MELNVPQCGYCQAGQVMQAISLLKRKPRPTDRDIDELMSGNICRWGTYQRIRAVIKAAASMAGANQMSPIQNVSRRGFLQDVFSAGALVLACCLLPDDLRAAAMEDTPANRAVFHPNVFLGLETDGTVYIIAQRSEMGNGSRTALPRVVADEMGADLGRVKILQAVGDARYASQDTDASRSILGSFQTMREAGARARLMLIRAAAAGYCRPEIALAAERGP